MRVQVCRCEEHGGFREYPTMVLPHKHYVVEVVEAALESRAQAVPVEAFCADWGLPEPSTPAAWIHQFEDRLVRLHGRLNRQLEALGDAVDVLEVKRQSPSLYGLVWGLLGCLKSACRRLTLPFASRAYQALYT